MPRPPPRQHKHERQYTSSTHSVILTRRIWNDDDDGQMILGDLGGDLKFTDICLTGEEKPRKNLTQETCPDRGSNPGPLRDKRAGYHLRWTKIGLYTFKLNTKIMAFRLSRYTNPLSGIILFLFGGLTDFTGVWSYLTFLVHKTTKHS